MIDIKGKEAQAFFQDGNFLYLDVKEVLSHIKDALEDTESRLSRRGKYNQHVAVILLCCALDDITKLAILGPSFENSNLIFSSLKGERLESESWEHKDTLLKVIKSSDRSRFRILKKLYHDRNSAVAHTCIPFQSDDMDIYLDCVKTLAKDVASSLEELIGRGGQQ